MNDRQFNVIAKMWQTKTAVSQHDCCFFNVGILNTSDRSSRQRRVGVNDAAELLRAYAKSIIRATFHFTCNCPPEVNGFQDAGGALIYARNRKPFPACVAIKFSCGDNNALSHGGIIGKRPSLLFRRRDVHHENVTISIFKKSTGLLPESSIGKCCGYDECHHAPGLNLDIREIHEPGCQPGATFACQVVLVTIPRVVLLFAAISVYFRPFLGHLLLLFLASSKSSIRRIGNFAVLVLSLVVAGSLERRVHDDQVKSLMRNADGSSHLPFGSAVVIMLSGKQRQRCLRRNIVERPNACFRVVARLLDSVHSVKQRDNVGLAEDDGGVGTGQNRRGEVRCGGHDVEADEYPLHHVLVNVGVIFAISAIAQSDGVVCRAQKRARSA